MSKPKDREHLGLQVAPVAVDALPLESFYDALFALVNRATVIPAQSPSLAA